MYRYTLANLNGINRPSPKEGEEKKKSENVETSIERKLFSEMVSCGAERPSARREDEREKK